MARVGDVVYSKAGHDKGKFYIVLKVVGEYVNIADGKSRKSDNPKKKKVKHLKFNYGFSQTIANKISGGEMITNKELRIELQKYIKSVKDENQGGKELG